MPRKQRRENTKNSRGSLWPNLRRPGKVNINLLLFTKHYAKDVRTAEMLLLGAGQLKRFVRDLSQKELLKKRWFLGTVFYVP